MSWETWLDRLSELGRNEPDYVAPRCLRERQSIGGCDLCARVCPHEAVTLGPLGDSVQIDPGLCTGCGLCVQVCPSGALEYDLTRPLALVRGEAKAAAGAGHVGNTSSITLTCSQTAAAANGVPALPCLARLTPATLSAAGAWGRELTLLHGDCAGCPVGGADVPAQLAAAVGAAAQLRQGGTPTRVTMQPETMSRGAADTATANATAADTAKVSRRGALRSLLGLGRREAAGWLEALPADLLNTGTQAEGAAEGASGRGRIPQEWRWRKLSLPPTQDAVHWPAPLVDDTCMDCPVCSNVCPTQAITRTHEPTEAGGRHFTLTLELEACTGCMACIRSCPPQAMHRQNVWRAAAFAAPLLLLERRE